MMTIFAIPKAFVGHEKVTQGNAVGSWLRLDPTPQVILCGNDPGVAEAADEFGVLHLADIAVNEFGTPLLDSAFMAAQAQAEFPLMCYVNSDIILLSDFPTAVQSVVSASDRFLMVGRRWNIDLTDSLDFSSGWEDSLRLKVSEADDLLPPVGSDFFVFLTGSLGVLPRFAVGRGGWDNWMFSRANELDMDLVDATPDTTVVHQNHDYAHIKEQSGPAPWDGPETERNRGMLGGMRDVQTLDNATHRLEGGRLVPVPPPPKPRYRNRLRRILRARA